MPKGFRAPKDGEKCRATSKRSGKPCERYAVTGSKVCHQHGAGTRKRVKSGERKDPTLAAVKHGRYSRFHDRILQQVADYVADPGMWEYDRMMALLMGSLERADEVSEVARDALVQVARRAQENGSAEAAALVITAAATASSTEALRQRALQEMGRLIAAKHRKDQAAGAISIPEMMAFLRWLQSVIIQLVSDPKVERAAIADRFVELIHSIAMGHGHSTGTVIEVSP